MEGGFLDYGPALGAFLLEHFSLDYHVAGVAQKDQCRFTFSGFFLQRIRAFRDIAHDEFCACQLALFYSGELGFFTALFQ